MTAVLAEPDRRIRVTLSEVLEGEGWTVVAAGPPSEVLERVIEPPALALIDLWRPREAEAFCVGMRIRYGSQVPLIGITRRGAQSKHEPPPGGPLGPSSVLHVPFAVSQLQELLRRLQALESRNRVLRAGSEQAVARLRLIRDLHAH